MPYNTALIMINKEDLHYVQRAARRNKQSEIEMLHQIIEKYRYPGSIL